MIKSLYIKNFILIDELFLDFEEGVNVFTGETGAGKTIILRAIDIVFGGKVNREVIKNDNQNALIELSFDDNGQEVIISREISKTGTKPRINGAFVNLDEIKEIREKLIDIHSQHQTYTYLAPKYHIELLDNYIAREDSSFLELLECYKQNYKEYKDVSSKYDFAKNNNEQNQRQIDLLKFQIKEIQDAEIFDNEEEELNAELDILSNAQELKETSWGAFWALNGDDENICEGLSKIQNLLSRISSKDENLKNITENLVNLSEEIKSCAYELRSYSENLEDDPKRLDEINERLSLIEKLKRKYGKDLSGALLNFESELKALDTNENNIEFLEARKIELLAKMDEKSKLISEKRKEYSKILSSMILAELKELELSNADFKIDIKEKDFGKNGIDDVEFLITTNISQELMPLAKVASGGEISRCMLAIKIVFANIDKIKTIIFDEIDTGISGKASQSVARAMKKLSTNCQVVVVTHQAIIASCANVHFWVSKEQSDTTRVFVAKLNDDKKKEALAQLAYGEVNEKSLEFAQQLLISCFNKP
ncbi:MAG: DNA repair protein RecN [Cyanobacteria bacterium SIG30]|nr:DNA repair protein RecN [Cyanobacteria bacterium SIG30]